MQIISDELDKLIAKYDNIEGTNYLFIDEVLKFIKQRTCYKTYRTIFGI